MNLKATQPFYGIRACMVHKQSHAGIHRPNLIHVLLSQFKVPDVEVLLNSLFMTDFGMATTPLCMCQRRTICATLFPYFLPIVVSTSLVKMLFWPSAVDELNSLHTSSVCYGKQKMRQDNSCPIYLLIQIRN